MTVFPIGFAYVITHTARAVVPESRLGAAYEEVAFETSDGLTLKGWYVPSKNGAAVISFPGRKGTQKPARMLARHGYGVLVFDRRGEGESDGEPDAFGWGGDRDVKAAVDFLQARPDIERDQIGGIGLSVGGEMMLEAAAEDHDLKAVVSDGAGARAFSDSLDELEDVKGMGPADKALNTVGAVRTGAMSVLTSEPPAANLKTLVGRIAPRPVMFIAAPNSNHGEELNRGFYAAAHAPKTLWELPEASHVAASTPGRASTSVGWSASSTTLCSSRPVDTGPAEPVEAAAARACSPRAAGRPACTRPCRSGPAAAVPPRRPAAGSSGAVAGGRAASRRSGSGGTRGRGRAVTARSRMAWDLAGRRAARASRTARTRRRTTRPAAARRGTSRRGGSRRSA